MPRLAKLTLRGGHRFTEPPTSSAAAAARITPSTAAASFSLGYCCAVVVATRT
jgi:hypothetical protein